MTSILGANTTEMLRAGGNFPSEVMTPSSANSLWNSESESAKTIMAGCSGLPEML